MGDLETYRVLVLGNLYYGEDCSSASAKALAQNGPAHSTEHLSPFIDASDSFIVNLETPLVDPEVSRSPSNSEKAPVHWADPAASGAALKALGVDAVSLANNHTMDHGPEGLESTFQTLSQLGVDWFGAGRNRDKAMVPYRVELPGRMGGGEIHFHGSHRYSTRNEEDFGLYADETSSGRAPLSVGDVPGARDASARKDALQVAFPHWGANYDWRSREQYRLAHRFLNKDYDLVLGHGSHALQEVHRKQQRWVIYGLGNGVFNSDVQGEQQSEKTGILPYSVWAMLEVHRDLDHRWLSLKLYPVYSDNRGTNFQLGPVSEKDFDRVIQALSERPKRPWRFSNPAQKTGKDQLGHFLELDLGSWELGQRPARLDAPTATGDPNEWPLRGPSLEVEDRVLALRKPMGKIIGPLAAEAGGAAVQWLTNELALIEYDDRRMLSANFRTHESPLGASIVGDKVLTAELLEKAGVSTPRTIVVDSADAAVQAATTLPGMVVVKPRSGSKSKGVSTGLVNEDEVREAFFVAREHSQRVIVQEHIEADRELRVMASPLKAVVVNGRVLPHVMGDGVSTIQELIEDKNLQRDLNPALAKRPIPVDRLTHRQLNRKGMTVNTVPAMGEVVTVRNVAGLSVGADPLQAFDESSAEIKAAAVSAMAAIPGLGWGGVDLIVEKNTGTPYVVEINTRAGYGQAVFPTYGEPRQVGADMWRLRHDATELMPMGKPQLTTPYQRSQLMSRTTAVNDDGQITIGHMLEETLARHGYAVETKSHRVLRATAPSGEHAWITRDGETTKDRTVVRAVMQRHHWVSKLLSVRDVPQARHRIVASARRLRAFVKGRSRPVSLAPADAAWDGPESHIMSEREALDLESLPAKFWVQARPAGRRVRILASTERVWAITSEISVRPLAEDLSAAAGEIAVEAVRAIPELRWAAVDLVIRQTRIRNGRPGGVLVEGLIDQPIYTTQTRVLAGDFDSFFQHLIKSA